MIELELTPEEVAFRDEVRAFIDAELTDELAAEVRRKLERARLTFRVMNATSDMLLNEALKEAGIDRAGDRLAVVASVRRGI